MKLPDDTPWWGRLLLTVVCSVLVLIAVFIIGCFGVWMYTVNEVVK